MTTFYRIVGMMDNVKMYCATDEAIFTNHEADGKLFEEIKTVNRVLKLHETRKEKSATIDVNVERVMIEILRPELERGLEQLKSSERIDRGSFKKYVIPDPPAPTPIPSSGEVVKKVPTSGSRLWKWWTGGA